MWLYSHSDSLATATMLTASACCGNMAGVTRPIPGYFFPLLSREDLTGREALSAFTQRLREDDFPRQDTLVYVHIPFCRSHCIFCGYYRQTTHEGEVLFERYIDRLLTELELWLSMRCLRFSDVKSMYIGGGTPSLLSPRLAGRLLEGLRSTLGLSPQVEITFEGEPATLKNDELLKTLREHHVTRCSFGVQTFDPDVRRLCKISASVRDVQHCAEALRRHRYAVCLDLMYGLPGQSLSTFMTDLEQAVDQQGASLVDLYPMVPYPNAPLYQGDRDTRVRLPTQDERRRMHDAALDFFESKGFVQYTFEDFCRPGHEYLMKRLTYGSDDGRAQTLALGACAVGYVGGHAYRNETLEPYDQTPSDRLPIALLRRASLGERRRRALFFYPRRLTLQPTCLADPLTDEEERALDSHVQQGLSHRNENGTFTLTRQGRLHADQMVLGLLSARERRKLFRLVQ